MTETEVKWSERVRDWRLSGKTAEQFAEGRGFEPTTLRYWASRLWRSKAASAESHVTRRVRLVRVERAGGAASTAPAIVIALGGGAPRGAGWVRPRAARRGGRRAPSAMSPHGVEIFVGTEPIDLRWGFDRLSGIVTERIARPPRSGALFVFFGKLETVSRKRGVSVVLDATVWSVEQRDASLS